jgi:glutamine amidotransferase
MGWNDLKVEQPHPLLDGVATGDHVYFVHSYRFEVADRADLLATARHGAEIAAVIARGNIVGTQFHPEKSQATGLRMIANFLRWQP